MGPSPARAATAKPYLPAAHAEAGPTRTPLEWKIFGRSPSPLLGLVCFVFSVLVPRLFVHHRRDDGVAV